jgi:hypothetical protein
VQLRSEETRCSTYSGGGGAIRVQWAGWPAGYDIAARTQNQRRGVGVARVSGSESRVQPFGTGEKLFHGPCIDFHPLDA